MGSLANITPKALIEFDGKPLIRHQIELAHRYGITDIKVCTGHLHSAIRDYLGDGSALGVEVTYSHEESPRGTAGAVAEIADAVSSECFIFYGDTFLDVSLDKMVDFHKKNESDATLLVHPNSHPLDSDHVEVDTDSRIVAFRPKPHADDDLFRNLVNAALYIVTPQLLRKLPKGQKYDFGRDFFPEAIKTSSRLFAYKTTEYIKDMGTPERKNEVELDLKSGRISRLRGGNLRRAVFLDRDGVINVEDGFISDHQHVRLIPGAAEAIRLINASGHLAVVVTNQSVLARNLCSYNDLEDIHKKLEMLLGREGAYLDEIYYCPHHPDGGYPEEIVELKKKCDCRKPAPGMLFRAANELSIDLEVSWIIGDRESDVAAGQAAGITRSIKIETNTNFALLKAVTKVLGDDHR